MRSLLIGGQACVFYGAAEFSRDPELAVLLDDANLECLRAALAELRSPELLLEVTERYPAAAARSPRAAVHAALRRDRTAVEDQLEAEEKAERAADRLYWGPLKEELQRLRSTRRDHP